MKSYLQLVHAMQSGVAAMMNYCDETSPKSLRVGVNHAMCDHAALARLLIEKGVFTMDEYRASIEAEMAREVERYEARLAKETGGNVKLG